MDPRSDARSIAEAREERHQAPRFGNLASPSPSPRGRSRQQGRNARRFCETRSDCDRRLAFEEMPNLDSIAVHGRAMTLPPRPRPLCRTLLVSASAPGMSDLSRRRRSKSVDHRSKLEALVDIFAINLLPRDHARAERSRGLRSASSQAVLWLLRAEIAAFPGRAERSVGFSMISDRNRAHTSSSCLALTDCRAPKVREHQSTGRNIPSF